MELICSKRQNQIYYLKGAMTFLGRNASARQIRLAPLDIDIWPTLREGLNEIFISGFLGGNLLVRLAEQD